MTTGDGDGWVTCDVEPGRHWGRHGAAGLVLLDPSGGLVALQRRAGWTHDGGTWGFPGGAIDSEETPQAAALREACEEAAVPATAIRLLGALTGVEHPEWRYVYVLARALRPIRLSWSSEETDEMRWVALTDVPGLELHPGLRSTWDVLRDALSRADASDRGDHRSCRPPAARS